VGRSSRGGTVPNLAIWKYEVILYIISRLSLLSDSSDMACSTASLRNIDREWCRLLTLDWTLPTV
jgi:hypothetical protein